MLDRGVRMEYVRSEARMQSDSHSHSDLRREVSAIKKQLSDVQVQFLELAKSQEFKLQRISQSVKRIEEMQDHLRQELARQYAEISGKHQERRISETKVSHLVDRHNSIVTSFESRMARMKKMMDEKEMLFLQTKSELEEAYRELQRSKRF